jgi:hypothetical protein
MASFEQVSTFNFFASSSDSVQPETSAVFISNLEVQTFGGFGDDNSSSSGAITSAGPTASTPSLIIPTVKLDSAAPLPLNAFSDASDDATASFFASAATSAAPTGFMNTAAPMHTQRTAPLLNGHAAAPVHVPVIQPSILPVFTAFDSTPGDDDNGAGASVFGSLSAHQPAPTLVPKVVAVQASVDVAQAAQTAFIHAFGDSSTNGTSFANSAIEFVVPERGDVRAAIAAHTADGVARRREPPRTPVIPAAIVHSLSPPTVPLPTSERTIEAVPFPGFGDETDTSASSWLPQTSVMLDTSTPVAVAAAAPAVPGAHSVSPLAQRDSQTHASATFVENVRAPAVVALNADAPHAPALADESLANTSVSSPPSVSVTTPPAPVVPPVLIAPVVGDAMHDRSVSNVTVPAASHAPVPVHAPSALDAFAATSDDFFDAMHGTTQSAPVVATNTSVLSTPVATTSVRAPLADVQPQNAFDAMSSSSDAFFDSVATTARVHPQHTPAATFQPTPMSSPQQSAPPTHVMMPTPTHATPVQHQVEQQQYVQQQAAASNPLPAFSGSSEMFFDTLTGSASDVHTARVPMTPVSVALGASQSSTVYQSDVSAVLVCLLLFDNVLVRSCRYRRCRCHHRRRRRQSTTNSA